MIDKNKQYKTRDGREVRIYATDGGGPHPVHGAWRNKGEEWRCLSWTILGGINLDSKPSVLDLIEVKPRMKIERWVLIWDSGGTETHECQPSRDDYPSVFAVKHVVFEVEEGEGLDAV
jgi:hypothetical protein